MVQRKYPNDLIFASHAETLPSQEAFCRFQLLRGSWCATAVKKHAAIWMKMAESGFACGSCALKQAVTPFGNVDINVCAQIFRVSASWAAEESTVPLPDGPCWLNGRWDGIWMVLAVLSETDSRRISEATASVCERERITSSRDSQFIYQLFSKHYLRINFLYNTSCSALMCVCLNEF